MFVKPNLLFNVCSKGISKLCNDFIDRNHVDIDIKPMAEYFCQLHMYYFSRINLHNLKSYYLEIQWKYLGFFKNKHLNQSANPTNSAAGFSHLSHLNSICTMEAAENDLQRVAKYLKVLSWCHSELNLLWSRNTCGHLINKIKGKPFKDFRELRFFCWSPGLVAADSSSCWVCGFLLLKQWGFH